MQHRKSSTLANMPPFFIDVLQGISKKFAEFGGVIFAFRGNKALPLYEDPGAPKPGSIHAKSSNQQFVAGLLPQDEKLSRIEKDGRIRGYSTKDFPLDEAKKIATPVVHHHKSLNSIMQGLYSTPPKFKLVGSEDDVKNTGQLRVISLNEHENHVTYSINLNVAESKATAPIKIDREKIRSSPEESKSPSWWNSNTMGNWEERSQYRYPIFYRTSDMALDSKDTALMVYGQKDEKGNTVQITSDQDLLWISLPEGLKKIIPESSRKVINTFNIEGTAMMIDELVKLNAFLKSHKKPTLELSDIRTSVAKLGCMTPFEAYMAILVNKTFGLEIEHIRDLIQHGCENRSPYDPSDLNSNMVHISHLLLHETENEADLVKLLLEDKNEYLKKNIITIHPGWNMELWAPVIERQLQIHSQSFLEEVPKETIINYLNYKLGVQIKNEAELVNMLLTDKSQFLKHNIIPIHPEFNIKLWSPVIERQLNLHGRKFMQSLTETTQQDYKEFHQAYPSMSVVIPKMHDAKTFPSDEEWKKLEKLAKDNSWDIDKSRGIVGEIRILDQTKLYAVNGNQNAINVLAKILKTLEIPSQRMLVQCVNSAMKSNLLQQLSAPDKEHEVQLRRI